MKKATAPKGEHLDVPKGKPAEGDDDALSNFPLFAAIPINVRDTTGTIIPKFRQHWAEATDPATGDEFEMASGAGLGNQFLHLQAKVKGKTIYHTVDMARFLQQWAEAVQAQQDKTPTDGNTE